ncbi:valyl-tRNA synthetase [Capronia epimyces CBS 606.96]|uniref:valine--tRNA ligase n=1 Tax=Capronia epimyces CBS 606.96 TaxID=1182542 RepID=W9Y4I3_9EURO|nr:valyl-tRNA synthetase [Capronia epimyces CBS 606.96]EXJ84136.1 valyl-tRNA synthetase [Capronia epimyces CBS 606.96]
MKAEKLEKFKAKQAKSNPAAGPKKEKVVKSNTTTINAYNPTTIERGRYEWWESNGFFKPQLENGKIKPQGKFVIPIPPPNVTGSLHMGHALTNALQDVMVRHARMRGKSTLWIPGCDHASISTQAVVENMLWRTQGKTRHEIGRDKLLEIIWDWTRKYKGNITNQLKRLGGSMDWEREAFTMDENLTEAVKATFIQLHEEGIIYRANRLVNWCPALETSLSNVEVDNKELLGRTKLTVPGYDKKIDFGVLMYFKYPVKKPSSAATVDCERFADYEFIEIATTRPETIFGDTAIAVHPTDRRYAHLVGRTAIHPFIPERRIAIIADEEVDPEFGTGAVKVTPAHDPADFIMGKKHGLEFINILEADGSLNENAGLQFAGQKRFEARYTVVTALKEKRLYIKEEDHAMTIPVCQRSKDIVEPILKPQWWMRMSNMAQAADAAVTNGEIKIQPRTEEKKFHYWMQTIQDWCLSRQLWWGHRVPAYRIQIEEMDPNDTSTDDTYWVCAHDEVEAHTKAQKRFPNQEFTLHQDEDVLDTWFSAGLWPWAILGWPKKTVDFESFYPTSMLETGWDILFFWVARMIMLGIKMTGRVPFTEVYCHSLVRDSEGRKMSKSLGNVIDPLDIINGTTLEALQAQLKSGNLDPREVERASAYQQSSFPNGISECGADALRFSLVNYTTGGGDIAFDIKEIEAKRRFCNKIYQATNFVLGRLGEGFQPSLSPIRPSSLAEKWILHKLNSTAAIVTQAIESRAFSASTSALHRYWLHEVCSVFLENSKTVLRPETDQAEQESIQQTLYVALEGGLLLLHPIMPYLTEHLWQKLPRRKGDSTPSIMIAKYPEFNPTWEDPEAVKDYEFILSIAEAIRGLLSLYGFTEPGNVLIKLHTAERVKLVQDQIRMITSLGGKYLGDVACEQASPDSPLPKAHALRSINVDTTVFLKIGTGVDLDDLRSKQQKTLDDARSRAQKIQDMMNKSGWAKVGSQKKEEEEARLQNLLSEADRLEAALGELERLTLEV